MDLFNLGVVVLQPRIGVGEARLVRPDQAGPRPAIGGSTVAVHSAIHAARVDAGSTAVARAAAATARATGAAARATAAAARRRRCSRRRSNRVHRCPRSRLCRASALLGLSSRRRHNRRSMPPQRSRKKGRPVCGPQFDILPWCSFNGGYRSDRLKKVCERVERRPQCKPMSGNIKQSARGRAMRRSARWSTGRRFRRSSPGRPRRPRARPPSLHRFAPRDAAPR